MKTPKIFKRTLREKVYYFTMVYVLRVSSGELIPKRFIWLKYLFFPIESYYTEKYGLKSISVDHCSRSFIIFGQRYPMDMFYDLSLTWRTREYPPVYCTYTLGRAVDGSVTIMRNAIQREVCQ